MELKTNDAEILLSRSLRPLWTVCRKDLVFKVVSTLNSDTTVYNPKKEKAEKISNLFVMKGNSLV